MSIIKVDNLSKKYVIGHDRKAGHVYRYQSLGENLAHAGRAIYQRLRHPLSPNIENTQLEDFWALKDLNFEIEPGDRLGIIGRNGAGKSTLLKVLSRITEPTTGRIEIDGRVASLLEVGTGFHPELTGRENIYLNGAVLGMKRAETRKKFDEIVEFSEIEQFLDTPVKRYSSGMYVRLAFAVAAHLEPEILIVDEVLAVGDAAFQKKCLGKMEAISKVGRTVLFVSHNMGAIGTLTNRCIVLDDGAIHFSGSTGEAVQSYFGLLNDQNREGLSSIPRTGNGQIVLTDCYFEDSENRRTESGFSGEKLAFVFEYSSHKGLDPSKASFGFSIDDQLGQQVFVCYNDYMGQTIDHLSEVGKCRFIFDRFPLNSGRYFIKVRVMYAGLEADWPKGVVATLDVSPGDFYRTGRVFHSGQGTLLLEGSWE